MAITVSSQGLPRNLQWAALPRRGTVQALCRQMCSSAISVADDLETNSLALTVLTIYWSEAGVE
jgi:hypothetical protein